LLFYIVKLLFCSIKLGRKTPGVAATKLSKITQDPAYSTEHRGANRKQDLRHWAASPEEQGIHYRPTGDPLHYRRQTS